MQEGSQLRSWIPFPLRKACTLEISTQKIHLLQHEQKKCGVGELFSLSKIPCNQKYPQKNLDAQKPFIDVTHVLQELHFLCQRQWYPPVHFFSYVSVDQHCVCFRMEMLKIIDLLMFICPLHRIQKMNMQMLLYIVFQFIIKKILFRNFIPLVLQEGFSSLDVGALLCSALLSLMLM